MQETSKPFERWQVQKRKTMDQYFFFFKQQKTCKCQTRFRSLCMSDIVERSRIAPVSSLVTKYLSLTLKPAPNNQLSCFNSINSPLCVPAPRCQCAPCPAALRRRIPPWWSSRTSPSPPSWGCGASPQGRR